MENQEYDDCYCPHGVAARQGTKVNNVFILLCAVVGYSILQGLVSLISSVFSSIGKAARAVSFEVVDIVGWTVLALSFFVVAALYIHDTIMNYIEAKKLPWYVKALVWAKNRIRAYFYRKDLLKRFEEGPELSEKTVEDILADMNDGHHDGEAPLTADEKAVYLEQFYKIRNEVVQQRQQAEKSKAIH